MCFDPATLQPLNCPWGEPVACRGQLTVPRTGRVRTPLCLGLSVPGSGLHPRAHVLLCAWSAGCRARSAAHNWLALLGWPSPPCPPPPPPSNPPPPPTSLPAGNQCRLHRLLQTFARERFPAERHCQPAPAASGSAPTCCQPLVATPFPVAVATCPIGSAACKGATCQGAAAARASSSPRAGPATRGSTGAV